MRCIASSRSIRARIKEISVHGQPGVLLFAKTPTTETSFFITSFDMSKVPLSRIPLSTTRASSRLRSRLEDLALQYDVQWGEFRKQIKTPLSPVSGKLVYLVGFLHQQLRVCWACKRTRAEPFAFGITPVSRQTQVYVALQDREDRVRLYVYPALIMLQSVCVLTDQ